MKEAMREAMQEKIFAAADALNEQGQKPTLILIRKEIGGGSYTTIQDTLKLWQARKTATTAPPTHEPVPQGISEKLGELGSHIWATAVEMANSRLTSERETLQAAQQETETLRQEATQLADHLTTELETAAARITVLETETTETRNKLATMQTRAETGEARADELRAELARAHADRDKALADAATAREEAAELRGRLKAIEEVNHAQNSPAKKQKPQSPPPVENGG